VKMAQSQLSNERMKIELEKRQIEEKLVLVSAECERLHSLLENYSIEVSNLKNRITILENDLYREKDRNNSDSLRKSQLVLENIKN
jgi:predicted  nucleic acid-binding Zn-ribbon protein